jgi:Mor family transcriptional regulator
MPNPKDRLRTVLLQHLYDHHQKARSLKGAGIKISELKTAMKNTSEMSQQDVIANLDYLIQKGWVAEEREEKVFKTAKGVSVPSISKRYKITDVGIDKIEGESAYQREEKYPGINITNVRGVMVIGDENVVNTRFADLYETLEQLKREVGQSKKLSDEEKLVVTSDIDSIENQIAKPEPDKQIITQLWASAEKVVTAAGLIEIGRKVASFLAPLLS